MNAVCKWQPQSLLFYRLRIWSKPVIPQEFALCVINVWSSFNLNPSTPLVLTSISPPVTLPFYPCKSTLLLLCSSNFLTPAQMLRLFIPAPGAVQFIIQCVKCNVDKNNLYPLYAPTEWRLRQPRIFLALFYKKRTDGVQVISYTSFI